MDVSMCKKPDRRSFAFVRSVDSFDSFPSHPWTCTQKEIMLCHPDPCHRLIFQFYTHTHTEKESRENLKV